jgi:hypothetical protein
VIVAPTCAMATGRSEIIAAGSGWYVPSQVIKLSMARGAGVIECRRAYPTRIRRSPEPTDRDEIFCESGG